MSPAAEPIATRQVLDDLLKYPIHDQLQIARSIPILRRGQKEEGLTIEFFLHVVVNLRDFGKNFFEKVALSKLRNVETPTIYRSFKNTGLECDWLESKLLEILNRSGFEIGTIETETFYHKRQKKMLPQLAVSLRGNKYIIDNNDTRHTFEPGDRVFFQPRTGRQLAPNVFAVYFTPVQIKQVG